MSRGNEFLCRDDYTLKLKVPVTTLFCQLPGLPRVMRDNLHLLDHGHNIIANGSVEESSEDGEVDTSLIKGWKHGRQNRQDRPRIVEGVPLEQYQQLKSKSRRRGRYLYAPENKGWNPRNLPDRTYLAAYLVYWLAAFAVPHGIGPMEIHLINSLVLAEPSLFFRLGSVDFCNLLVSLRLSLFPRLLMTGVAIPIWMSHPLQGMEGPVQNTRSPFPELQAHSAFQVGDTIGDNKDLPQTEYNLETSALLADAGGFNSYPADLPSSSQGFYAEQSCFVRPSDPEMEGRKSSLGEEEWI
ncbi:hypothetical protein Taro_028344 [Colocasia esculenta]|uniref:Uncharacterized protein n=1 Tax=Colocasia esculenta TaxID=4460 RepID=A0A843VKT9_COLES|nr:hypothetical protein [Colocasia esculenta]